MIVAGSVLDNDMGIIPYANVLVVGELVPSVSADENGRFVINVSGPASVLQFSHAGFDYDQITVAEFLEDGYIQLYPSTLPDATVINNTPKKSDNTIWWVLGAVAVTVFALSQGAGSSKNKSVKVVA